MPNRTHESSCQHSMHVPKAAADAVSACVLCFTVTPTGARTSAHIPFLWHKGRDFMKRDAKGKETKVRQQPTTPYAVTCCAGCGLHGFSVMMLCVHKASR